MSIPVGVRNVPETPSNTRCETVDACRLLCEHVLRITQFKRFTDVVASEDIRLYVRQLAVDAFISAQVANEQRADKDPSLAEVRRDNQLVMLDSLKRMLPAIYVAQKADECLTSYLAYIERGNTYRLQQRLIAYQNELWRKI